MKLLAIVGGIAFGVTAFRDLPPLGHRSALAVGICGIVLLVAAYLAGKKAGQNSAHAEATATATAEAHGGRATVRNRQAVNVVVMPQGADVQAAAAVIGGTAYEVEAPSDVLPVAASSAHAGTALDGGRSGVGAPDPAAVEATSPVRDAGPDG